MSFDEAVQAFEEGRFRDALGQFHALLHASPGDPDLYYNIACCHAALGHQDEAREALREALARKPSYRQDALQEETLRDLLDEEGRLQVSTSGDDPRAPVSPEGEPSFLCPSCGVANDYNNWKCTTCGAHLHRHDESEHRQPLMSHYKDMLWPAIFCTLCCCLPTGIASIVYAANARAHASQGDMVLASQASKNAETWFWVSVGLGLVGLLIQLAASSA